MNAIKDLDPKIQLAARAALDDMRNSKELKAMGVTGIVISETRRELTVQMAYYARSRMSVTDVKAMYKAAGLYAIPDEDCKKPVTWTLNSMHVKGLAVDFVPEINGKVTWGAPLAVWQEMGRIGKSHGFTWGGDWREKDFPHFQWDK